MQLSSQARKAVALGLTASTILWASLLGLAPIAVSAAVHSEGCLVLSGGVVWLITGGTRRGFTSAEVFASHGYNFSQVVAATAEDTALPVGPIMTYADGTLVKGPNDPLVYVVTGGQKRGFVSGTVFLGRGYKFSNIQQAPVNTFQDLPTGANVDNTTDAHSTGVWVISNGTIYRMVVGGRAAVPDWATWASYGRSLSIVVAANAADMALPAVANLAARPLCTGGGNPPPVSGSFSVSLASDTPGATSIIADATNGGQALAPMLKLNFIGGSSGATVTTITFHRIGVGNDGKINNAYLYDGNTRLAQMQSISSGNLVFTNSAGLFTVSPNTVRSVTLKMDLAASATAGQTFGFALNTASDVVATGGVNPSGSFPISGNLMTVATVSDLGKLTFGTVLPSSNGTVDPGQTNYEVARFPLTAANQNLQVSYIAFTNLGSIAAGNLQNFKLTNSGVQVGPTVVQQDGNRMVIFDLSGSPLNITSGVTVQLSLRADIVAGSTLTYQFSIQNSSDIVVKDMQYGVFVFPGGGSSFSVQKAAGIITINSGSMVVSKTSDSPTGGIAVGGTNITLAKFQLTASGESIKVTTLTILSTVTASHTIANVKLYANGVQLGTTATTLLGDGTATAAYNLGNSLVVVPGTPTFVTVVADTTAPSTGTQVANSDTVLITLKQGSSNGQGVVSLSTLNVPTGNVAANTLTATTTSLTSGKNPALAAVTVAKGSTNQTIASMLLTAGSAEAVNLNTVVIVDRNSADNANGANGLGAAFSNLKLFYNGNQVGNTIGNPSSVAGTQFTFTLSPNITIPAGQPIQLDVRADVLSSTTWTNGDKVGVHSSTTGLGAVTSTSVSPSTLALQGITIATAGTVTLSLDGLSPSNAQQLVMGSTANVLGVWQFQANNVEDLNVNQIIVTSTTTVGGDVQNLKLMVNNSQVGNTVPALSAATNGTATFGSSATTLFTVSANGFVRVTLVGDATSTTNATGATSLVFAMKTPASITGAAANDIIVTGRNSGNFATLASASQTYSSQASLTYRTKIVATNVTVPGNSTGRVRQANDTIFKMNMAANSGFQVAFRAAGNNTADTSTTAWTGGITPASTWAVVTVGDDGSTLATDSTNKIQGAASQQVTQGATTPVAGNGMTNTFAAQDLSGFSGIAVWARASRASVNTTLTLTGASAGSHTMVYDNNNQWKLFVIPFATATTPFTGLTAVTAISIVSASAWTAADTLNIDNVYFYKDFIKTGVNGLAFLTDATLMTLKDSDSGTTFATGYFDGTGATATTNTTGTAYFFPTTEFDVSAGGNRNLSLVTDTSALLSAAASSVSVNVNLGSSASTVGSPGDIVWYDGKVSGTNGVGNAVPWVDTQPNPVQGATLGY